MPSGFGTNSRDESSAGDSASDKSEPVPSRLTLIGGKDALAAGADTTSQENQYKNLASKQAAVLDLLAQCLDQPSLQTSLSAVVGELHQRFECDRVVLGLYRNTELDVCAISQQVSIDRRSGEIQLLRDAMQEACEQDAVIRLPEADSNLTITMAHKALVSGDPDRRLCTIPMAHEGILIGALLFEAAAGDSMDSQKAELQQQMAAVIAPLISLRQAAEAGLAERAGDAWRQIITGWITPRYLRAKLLGSLVAAVLLATHFIPVTHHLRATAELVSSERRLITSPFQGYIGNVHVDVGDQVRQGQSLLSLDTADLDLQVESLTADIQSAESEYRSAMASHDRADMAVAQARLDQGRAELKLITAQKDRASLIAPIDGLIISGDVSQMVGAPVDRGVTLLEMAPGENFEVRLMLNESDMGYVSVGQQGHLSLTSAPANEIPFIVTAIHPIAVSAEGVTRFQIDAEPADSLDGMRPGQTGIARIEAGSAGLLWVWTHRFFEWAQLRIWALFG